MHLCGHCLASPLFRSHWRSSFLVPSTQPRTLRPKSQRVRQKAMQTEATTAVYSLGQGSTVKSLKLHTDSWPTPMGFRHPWNSNSAGIWAFTFHHLPNIFFFGFTWHLSSHALFWRCDHRMSEQIHVFCPHSPCLQASLGVPGGDKHGTIVLLLLVTFSLSARVHHNL